LSLEYLALDYRSFSGGGGFRFTSSDGKLSGGVGHDFRWLLCLGDNGVVDGGTASVLTVIEILFPAAS